MKLHLLSPLALASAALSSCVYYTTPVPEMPYSTSYRTSQAVMAPYVIPGYSNVPVEEPAWEESRQAAEHHSSSSPTPAAAAPLPIPALESNPNRLSGSITQPHSNALPTPATPSVRPAPAASTATRTPKEITNNGPIPVATPVPGDPTRVYNPLDSSKTIRITDKNGNIYPSGKELKVRGTNFHFYVP